VGRRERNVVPVELLEELTPRRSLEDVHVAHGEGARGDRGEWECLNRERERNVREPFLSVF
jgi:hypothetical protein